MTASAEPDTAALACTLREAALRVLSVRGVRSADGATCWPDRTPHGPAPPLQLVHCPSSADSHQRVLVFAGAGQAVLHVEWANGAMLAFRKAGVAPTRVGWLRVMRFERGAWETELHALVPGGLETETPP